MQSLDKATLCILLIVVTGCSDAILHDLSEAEANKIQSRLAPQQIRSEKVLQPDGRWSIKVKAGDSMRALTYIDHTRLLARRDEQPGRSGKRSLLSSREESWLRYEQSLAFSIEETLVSVPGVIEARVHLNIAQSDPIFGVARHSRGSGSVLLIVNEQFGTQVEEIGSLVAGAAGLESGAIQVLTSRAIIPEMVSAAAEAQSKAEVAKASDVKRASAALIVFGAVGALVVGWNRFRTPKKEAVFPLEGSLP